MEISFHGAAEGVTGSCHMITCAGKKILIDCGMFQGGHELKEDNAEPFGFDPRQIDVLLLTHAHLDHCGRIPLLVKQGFRGEIICTAATRDLARLVMLDSAHLHEEEAKRRWRHGNHSKGNEPLYDTMDAFDAMDRFGRNATYDKPIHLGRHVTATFVDAGHILGSASILLELEEEGHKRRVLFSGDLGPDERPLLSDNQAPSNVDIVVMETTYGDRDHRPLQASVDEFYDAIRDAQERGGNIIIPTFALERAQELLFYLREGMERKEIPDTLHVFLDSPMAISATQIFRRHPEAMRTGVERMLNSGQDPFQLPNLRFTRESHESMALNRIRSGAILMAGSGMCTGGRVRHHLRHNLAHSDCSVIFVGFAAKGTLARIIVDGARSVRLWGREIPVKAKIHTINGFSAHAGRSELLAWHRQAGKPEITFLVHGEQEEKESFAKALKHTRVEMPKLHQSYKI
jgi:metallo-beta-lactamase family protein